MRRLLTGVVLIGVLSASPAVAEKPRVVVLDFTSSSDKLKRAASSVAEQTLTELSRSKTVEVLGASDVTALLGMERERQLLGCTESSTSCLAEITAAMGAPWLVMGNLAQLGKVTRIDIKLIRAADGKAVVREGKNLSDESEIFAFVNSVVPLMLEWMQPKAGPVVKSDPPKPDPAKVAMEPVKPVPEVSTPPIATVATPSPAGAPVAPWVLVGAGGLVTIAGAITFGFALAWHDDYVRRLRVGDPLPPNVNYQDLPTYTQAQADLSLANTLMLIGGVGAGVGLAGIAGGLTWRFKKPGDTATAVTITPGPGSFIVRGEF